MVVGVLCPRFLELHDTVMGSSAVGEPSDMLIPCFAADSFKERCYRVALVGGSVRESGRYSMRGGLGSGVLLVPLAFSGSNLSTE